MYSEQRMTWSDCFNVVMPHSIYSFENRLETQAKKIQKQKNRMPRLKVITRNWFDWLVEIGKSGSGKEKLNTGYVLRRICWIIECGRWNKERRKNGFNISVEYLERWSCYELRRKDCRKRKFRVAEQQSRFVQVQFEMPLQLEEELLMRIWIHVFGIRKGV